MPTDCTTTFLKLISPSLTSAHHKSGILLLGCFSAIPTVLCSCQLFVFLPLFSMCCVSCIVVPTCVVQAVYVLPNAAVVLCCPMLLCCPSCILCVVQCCCCPMLFVVQAVYLLSNAVVLSNAAVVLCCPMLLLSKLYVCPSCMCVVQAVYVSKLYTCRRAKRWLGRGDMWARTRSSQASASCLIQCGTS